MLNSLLQRKGRRSLFSDSIMYFSDEQLFLETGENVLLIFRYSNNTVRTIMYLSLHANVPMHYCDNTSRTVCECCRQSERLMIFSMEHGLRMNR